VRRRWWRRAAAGAALFAALETGLALAGAGPDPVRLALLVTAGVAVLGLALDALSDPAPAWDMEVERPSTRAGGDQRLGLYVNLIEAHLAARSDDASVRDRLGALADQVLRQRHGVPRGDARAAELLGPELTAVLTGPVRRLSPADIDRCLTRIEEL
jgi:hypothetical protein